jgi:hypothetical protein
VQASQLCITIKAADAHAVAGAAQYKNEARAHGGSSDASAKQWALDTVVARLPAAPYQPQLHASNFSRLHNVFTRLPWQNHQPDLSGTVSNQHGVFNYVLICNTTFCEVVLHYSS